ncbi:RNA-directed DNA polymerase [Bordetella trematum]|uniref:RNA-directed DNA polymerase n=1 Tax=Bordetella trematum TaxID=123899 RepID=UPI0004B7D3C3|nr:RNA-directed DNA polymerase [Bordetella trematum]
MLSPEFHHFKRAACEIAKHGDNDTLPFDFDVRFCGEKANELATIAHGFYQELRNSKAQKDNNLIISSLSIDSERLVAPSGPAGFRVVTKIPSFWNIYLNGLCIAIAEGFEPQRSPHAHSYRFVGQDNVHLFDPQRSWRAFKEATVAHAINCEDGAIIVQTDISSFYEHISHHYIENIINALDGDGPQVSRQINALLNKFSAGRSFGLPVGGQGARILAELFLDSIDRSLSSHGINWHRYVDDYVLICSDTADAYRTLAVLAQCLMDYGLTLNKSKTVLLSTKHYCDYVRAQLGDDEEATKLRSIDLRFDPYSDNAEQEYESLRETVESLEVRQLLNRELEKALPDSFLVTQIGRTMRLHSPEAALDLARTLLSEQNLHAFRASFSTIMRGVVNLRSDENFAAIHEDIDGILDEIPIHSAHLLKVDTSMLHYLRSLRFASNAARSRFLRQLFDSSQHSAIRRGCIECWRGWGDRGAFNNLRNNWARLTPECQRSYWLASFSCGDEGRAARRQGQRAALQSWSLGVEPQIDANDLENHPRRTEPKFAEMYLAWAEAIHAN